MWILLASAGLLLTPVLEPLRTVLGLTPLPWVAWALVAVALSLSWAFAMLMVAWLRRHEREHRWEARQVGGAP